MDFKMNEEIVARLCLAKDLVYRLAHGYGVFYTQDQTHVLHTEPFYKYPAKRFGRPEFPERGQDCIVDTFGYLTVSEVPPVGGVNDPK